MPVSGLQVLEGEDPLPEHLAVVVVHREPQHGQLGEDNLQQKKVEFSEQNPDLCFVQHYGAKMWNNLSSLESRVGLVLARLFCAINSVIAQIVRRIFAHQRGTTQKQAKC